MKSHVLLAIVLAVGCLGADAFSAEPDRPNIVLIMVDDISAKDFPLYGAREVKTPFLDKIASDGVWFRTFWATPVCQPTRHSIMTGQYASKNNCWQNKVQPRKGDPQFPTYKYRRHVFHIARAAGYATGWFGKTQIPGTPRDAKGLDELCHVDESFFTYAETENPTRFNSLIENGKVVYQKAYFWQPTISRNGTVRYDTKPDDFGPKMCLDAMLEFIGKSAGNQTPFVAYWASHLGHNAVNYLENDIGYPPVPKIDNSGNIVPGVEGGGPTGSEAIQYHVKFLDYAVRRICDKLAELGQDDNTVILITSDNGRERYGKMVEGFHQERGPRVPLIVYGKGIVPAAGASDELSDVSDITPTIADFIGADVSQDNMDGRSLRPHLLDTNKKHRDWILSCCARLEGEPKPVFFVRTKRYLLDANGKLWDTKGLRDEEGYEDVTDSSDPEVLRIGEYFASVTEEFKADTGQPWWHRPSRETTEENGRKKTKENRRKKAKENGKKQR